MKNKIFTWVNTDRIRENFEKEPYSKLLLFLDLFLLLEKNTSKIKIKFFTQVNTDSECEGLRKNFFLFQV